MSGDVAIAYQQFGEGDVDLVWTPGAFSNVELAWERPEPARFYRALGSFARVILFDKRGTGLSDPTPVLPVDCALAIARGVEDLGLHIRGGLHTGECEAIGPATRCPGEADDAPACDRRIRDAPARASRARRLVHSPPRPRRQKAGSGRDFG